MLWRLERFRQINRRLWSRVRFPADRTPQPCAFFAVAIWNPIPALGVLILRVVDSQIPLAVLVKPMPANELILLLSRGLMFAPRIPLVDYDFVLVDQLLRVVEMRFGSV